MFRFVFFAKSAGWRSSLSVRCLSDSKTARAARRAKMHDSKASGAETPILTRNRVAAGSAILLSSAFALFLDDAYRNPDSTAAKIYRDSRLQSLLESAYAATFGSFVTIFKPSSDELLPTWPTAPCYQGIPLGTPAPPLLVVDVEKTLIGSEYDAKHGWRHVKRPGVDKFINTLSQYYEIVLFSENDIGAAQEILMAVDPEGRCHKLGSAAAESRGSDMLKRLDLMNRDVAKIVLIDDNPVSSQLFPRNTLLVQPFTNVRDSTDSALLDLIPLLQAIVHEGSPDFRDALDHLGTHDAEEAVAEYKMRVMQKLEEENQKRNKGIGGFARNTTGSPRPELPAFSSNSTIMSASQIVAGGSPIPLARKPEKQSGNKCVAEKKKGALLLWLEEQEKEKAANEARKEEKYREIQSRRMNG